NKEKLQALGSVTPYSTPATKAPMAIVACYRKECRVPLYAQIDMSACVENILLEADALELGAVWLGIAPLEDRMKAVSEILNIPDTLEVFAVIPCGYPEKVRPQQDRYEENRVHYVE
ncbi:nitroreductase family protein, partial [Intestinibacter sp.]